MTSYDDLQDEADDILAGDPDAPDVEVDEDAYFVRLDEIIEELLTERGDR